MTYCIEEAEIAGNHRTSRPALWLETHGFTLHRPEDTFHRVGPWIFVNSDSLEYRYCPHFGTGPSEVFENVHLSFEEFKAVWTAVMSASGRKAMYPNWADRIKAQAARQSDGLSCSTRSAAPVSGVAAKNMQVPMFQAVIQRQKRRKQNEHDGGEQEDCLPQGRVFGSAR